VNTIPSRDFLLDNPVWHALTGPLASFADREAHAKTAAIRFDRKVAFFGAADRLDAGGWAALAGLIGTGGVCVLFRHDVPTPPDGWHEEFRGPCFQLVADDLPARPELDLVELGAADVDDMLELTQLTEPGPFFARTHTLGRYVGVRRGGRLVAMAGERFRVPGFVEISAVCTHPDVRGERLGGALTLEIAHGIRERGDEAFLHVMMEKENAYEMYLKLGFRLRRNVDVVAAWWHDDGLPADAPRNTGEDDATGHLPDSGANER